MIKFLKDNKNYVILICLVVLGVLVFALLSKQIGAFFMLVSSLFSLKDKKVDVVSKQLKENITTIATQITESKKRQEQLEKDIQSSKENVVKIEETINKIYNEKLTIKEMLYLLNN